MKLSLPPRKKARIEIIPMIDAIFFLLVFFMFSSLSMVKMNGLAVALPKAPPTPAANAKSPASVVPKVAAKPAPPRRLVLTVRGGTGGATLGDVPVKGGVTQAVTAALVNAPDAVIVVRAARGATTQTLVETLDALNAVRLPNGGRAKVVVATVAAAPTTRTNVLLKGNAK